MRRVLGKLLKVSQYLQDEKILKPSDDTLNRLISTQKEKARDDILKKITSLLTDDMKASLEDIISVSETERFSKLQQLKRPPGNPSPDSMKSLVRKLNYIKETQILSLNLDWLNNNYKRMLTKYCKRSSAHRLRKMEERHRYATIICFLNQTYKDTVEQHHRYNRNAANRTYKTKFREFALEFYTFVADNYAPFYSTPIECAERDSSYVLDGIHYNESDLELEEHYVDTHGYTEINFAGFAMNGKIFCPRIKDIKHQRIYRIDTERDYGKLSPLVDKKDRTIHLNWIEDQWDKIAHFHYSLASGHATASTAMKRLAGFSGSNHFYRAHRELGRIFKTEHILDMLSNPDKRKRTRKGLLKGEQIHQLARDVAYGKRGKISARDLQEQKNTCSCLTVIMACIIYWQSKEIGRVIDECDPESSGINLSMIEHISPIEWENIILYGEYILNRSLIHK